MVGAGGIIINRADMVASLMKLTFYLGGEDSKQLNTHVIILH